MGNIKVSDYLCNLTKFDDIERDMDNRIILDKYIDRVHADKIHCRVPGYSGFKAPSRPYDNYEITSPYAKYLAKERRNSPHPILKDNVEKPTRVHNEAIFGKMYNDLGVNSVEAYVAYRNTPFGKLYYSITEHLKSIRNLNKDKLVYYSPSFFLHLQDMLENKTQYLQSMTPSCFDDLTNSLIVAILTGESDMHTCNTLVLKAAGDRRWTDICRVGVDERVFNDVVESNGSLDDIKQNFNTSDIYSNSSSSSNGKICISPRDQIEGLMALRDEGLLSASNIQTIENLVNYNIDECVSDRREFAGAMPTDSHIDAIKYYISQAEVLAK